LLCLTQSISTSAATSNGLGKPMGHLNDTQIQSAQKAQYAATILLITCLATTKMSIVFFVQGLSPIVSHRKWCHLLGGATIIWFFVALLTTVFQCAPPRTWDDLNGKRCVNLRAWWTFVAAGNIFTDLSIVTLQVYVLWGIQLQISRKILLLAIFSTRLTVVGAAITQLVLYITSLGSLDVTFRAWLPVVLNGTVQFLRITTSCIPHIKRFLDSLESGMIRVEDPTEEATEAATDDRELKTIGGSNPTGVRSYK
ncbi:hypothetical protein P154DRAFT_434126, partial [Amniculicola lignicola CBS 123094]